MATSSTKKGFSTIEMLIAMTILILTLSAVTLTSFGSQTSITDAEIDREALAKAQGMLEQAQLLARKDFMLVTSTTSTESVGPITYTESLVVSTTTPPDYAVKNITSIVSWTGEHGRNQKVTLSGIVTNFDHAVGGDTCDSEISAADKIRWTNTASTSIVNTITLFNSLIGAAAGATNTIAAIDAHKGKLYVALSSTPSGTDPTFFIFDITKLKVDPANALLSKLDTAPSTKDGLYALHIAEGTTTGSMYAYVANVHPANWGTCTEGPACSQLQIVNVSSPTKITTASTTYYKIVTTGSMPPITWTSGQQGVGYSIFYKDGQVYLGLAKTATGPEFNIIDVHDPLHPVWVGGYSVGYTVNAINVVGNYAYLATNDPSHELLVLDVTNPTSPSVFQSYDAPGGGGSVGLGQSLYKMGDNVYLGRTNVSGSPEFYALDASNTATSILSMGNYEAGGNINGIVVRGNIGFIANETSSAFHILDLKNLSSINDLLSLPLPANSIASSLDCEGNDMFISSRDPAVSISYLSVITTHP